MIQHLNRYNLDRPEEQKKVEVNESVIDIVKSTYDIWLQYHRRSLSIDTLRSSLLAFDKAHGEQLYEEAVALLSPHSKEFTNVGQRDLEIILSTVKDSDTEVSGLYLSAMLNSTDLEELDGVFNFTFLGYKLAADKKLIVREGSNVLYLGTLSQGLLINYGNAEHIALHAIGGLHVNFGKVYSMASGATGGVQVNLGKANHLGEGAKGGVQLSYSTNLQDKPISDGYILNDIDLARGYAIDLITKALETDGKEWKRHFNQRWKKANPLELQSNDLFTQINFLGVGEESTERLLKAISKFNWQSFEKNVINLTEQIRDVYR